MTPAAPFGPEVQYWYNRIHALKLMKRMILKPSGRHNRSNNYRFASHMMDSPKTYNLVQIADGIHYCRIKQKEARNKAGPAREVMLRERLTDAIERKDSKKAAGIKQILNTENSKKNWGIVNATLNDPRAPPLASILREEGDQLVRHETEGGVEMVFKEECIARYNLAKKAPIMRSSMACHEEVLKADFDVLMKILEGEEEVPRDVDEVTKAYLEEIIEMTKKNELETKRQPEMTKHYFSEFWRRVNEHTQSSVSGLHYGTYKAAAKDEDIAEAQALQLTLVARSGVHPVGGRKHYRCS